MTGPADVLVCFAGAAEAIDSLRALLPADWRAHDDERVTAVWPEASAVGRHTCAFVFAGADNDIVEVIAEANEILGRARLRRALSDVALAFVICLRVPTEYYGFEFDHDVVRQLGVLGATVIFAAPS